MACHDLLRAYAAELVRAADTEAARHGAVRRILDYYLARDTLGRVQQHLGDYAAAITSYETS